MKKSLFIILFCGSLLFFGQSAIAQQRVGIGAMINSPTGVSAKAWINYNIAVDGALAFTLTENTSQLYLHSNVLQHGDITEAEALQQYYGLGIRLIWSDIGNDVIAGLRGPIGTTYAFEDSNIESFFEIVPTLDFTPDARFFFGGAVGMRVYLN